jgi:hypothetical protein
MNQRALLLYLYAGVLVATALALPTVLVATGARLHGGISLAILAGVAVLAERGA